MPAAKRQKKTRNSDVSHADDNTNDREALGEVSGNDCANPACPNKHAGKGHDYNAAEKKADPKLHDYICSPRPFFDVEAEGTKQQLDGEDIFEKLYKPGFEAEKKASIFWR
ncbi:Nn.00g093070.m01.CDS01 [Neocucurbitaria sp. VM-36]